MPKRGGRTEGKPCILGQPVDLKSLPSNVAEAWKRQNSATPYFNGYIAYTRVTINGKLVETANSITQDAKTLLPQFTISSEPLSFLGFQRISVCQPTPHLALSELNLFLNHSKFDEDGRSKVKKPRSEAPTEYDVSLHWKFGANEVELARLYSSFINEETLAKKNENLDSPLPQKFQKMVKTLSKRINTHIPKNKTAVHKLLGGVSKDEVLSLTLTAETMAKFLLYVRREEDNTRAKLSYERKRIKESEGKQSDDIPIEVQEMADSLISMGCYRVNEMSREQLESLHKKLKSAAYQDLHDWSNAEYQKVRNYDDKLNSLGFAKAGRKFLALNLFANVVHPIKLESGRIIGAYVDLEFLLSIVLHNPEFCSFLKPDKINIGKLTGDGGKLTSDTNFVVLAIQFVENPEKCQGLQNIIPFAVAIEDESSEVVKAMAVKLNEFLKKNDDPSYKITGAKGQKYKFDFVHCYDLKFTWIVEGHEGVHNEFGQLCSHCAWPQKCGTNTDAGEWPKRIVGEDGKLSVDHSAVKKYTEENKCTCAATDKNHDDIFLGKNGINGETLIHGLDPEKNLWHDVVLHGKNRCTEKFVKLWIWGLLNPTTDLKKAFAKSRSVKLQKIHSFLEKVELKKFKVQLEGNSVIFSKQFKGANFSLVVDKFEEFSHLFCLTEDERNTWMAFQKSITLARLWREGDGSSEMTEFAIGEFTRTVEDLILKYVKVYGSKHVTVYLHILCFETLKLLQRFPNLQRYCQQSMEALIGALRRDIFHRSGGMGQLVFRKSDKQDKKEDTDKPKTTENNDSDDVDDEGAESDAEDSDVEVYSNEGVKIRRAFQKEDKVKEPVSPAHRNCLKQVLHLYLRRLVAAVICPMERKTQTNKKAKKGEAAALKQLKEQYPSQVLVKAK
jgi:hypothetical protein